MFKWHICTINALQRRRVAFLGHSEAASVTGWPTNSSVISWSALLNIIYYLRTRAMAHMSISFESWELKSMAVATLHNIHTYAKVYIYTIHTHIHTQFIHKMHKQNMDRVGSHSHKKVGHMLDKSSIPPCKSCAKGGRGGAWVVAEIATPLCF